MGFGFVTFKHESCAERAKKYWNGKEIDGRTIEVNDADPLPKDILAIPLLAPHKKKSFKEAQDLLMILQSVKRSHDQPYTNDLSQQYGYPPAQTSCKSNDAPSAASSAALVSTFRHLTHSMNPPEAVPVSSLAIGAKLSSTDGEPELNILRFKAVFIDNLKHTIDFQTLVSIFGSYGPIFRANIKPTLGAVPTFAVIEFIDYESPQKVLTDHLQSSMATSTGSNGEGLMTKRKNEIQFDLKTPLVIKFTPSSDQRKALSSGTKARNWAKWMIDNSGECFEWRFNSFCSVGRNCGCKHVVKHRGIDTLKSFNI